MPLPLILIIGIPAIGLLLLIPAWVFLFVLSPLLGLIIWPFWKMRRRGQYWQGKRSAAISEAIANMDANERDQYSNVFGIYRDARAIPRSISPEFMTTSEDLRRMCQVGEFSPSSDEYVISHTYD